MTPNGPPAKTVVKFMVVESPFTDTEAGWIEWSDGTKQYAVDVLKDPEDINEVQRTFLKQLLAEHMLGLVSLRQVKWLYAAILHDVLTTDISSKEIQE